MKRLVFLLIFLFPALVLAVPSLVPGVKKKAVITGDETRVGSDGLNLIIPGELTIRDRIKTYQSDPMVKLILDSNYASGSLADKSTIVGDFSRASVKVDYASGSYLPTNTPQFQTTLTASPLDKVVYTAAEDGVMTPADIQPLVTDADGWVWGRQFSDQSKLFYIDPSSGTTWTELKDFGASGNITSAFVSEQSGYLFVGLLTGLVYRDTTHDASDDFVEVLNLDSAGEVTNTCYMDAWSFTSAPDGRVWIAQYGDRIDTGETGDAAMRVFASPAVSEGASASWVKVFDHHATINGDDPSSYYHDGIHLHKILWNQTNGRLYLAVGDTDPTYFWYDEGGDGDSWQRIETPSVYNVTGFMQPTAGTVLPSGNIMWGSDTNLYGFWLHDVSTDSFSAVNGPLYYNTSTAVATYGIPGILYFNLYQYDGVVYLPGYDLTNDSGEVRDKHLWAVSASTPAAGHQVIDSVHATGNDVIEGWQKIAGIGGDGYIWATFMASDGTSYPIKYAPVTLTVKSGLRVDEAVTANYVADPYFNTSDGNCDYWAYWDDVDRHLDTGGKYLSTNHRVFSEWTHRYPDSACSVAGAAGYTLDNYIRLSTFAKQGTPSSYAGSTAGIALIASFRSAGGAQRDASYIQSAGRILPIDSWQRLTAGLPGGSDATIAGLQTQIKGGSAMTATTNYHYIDGVMVLEGSSTSPPRDTLIQASRSADSISYTLSSAVTYPLTVVGVTKINYAFSDTTAGTKYSIVELYKDSDEYERLVIDAAAQDVLLENDSGTIATASASIPTAMDYDNEHGGDTYYWAIVYEEDGVGVTVYFQTQRSGLESATAAAHTLQTNMVTIYDGCSHTAGQEIGGTVVRRMVAYEELSISDIREYWNGEF